MRKENSYLTKRLDEMVVVLDRQRQHYRHNCFLIHGVNEVEGEGIGKLSIKLIKTTYGLKN